MSTSVAAYHLMSSMGICCYRISKARIHQCVKFSTKAVKPPLRNLTVAIGTNVVLPCELTSNLAQPVWTFNGRELSQEDNESMLYDITLQALVILGVDVHHSGTYYCFSVEQETRFASEIYQLSVVASPSLTLESRAPMDGLGLVWMMVIALGAVCLVLFLAVIYLRRKLQDEMEKGSKSLKNTLVYPIQLPSQPKMTKCLPCQAQIQISNFGIHPLSIIPMVRLKLSQVTHCAKTALALPHLLTMGSQVNRCHHHLFTLPTTCCSQECVAPAATVIYVSR